MLVVASRQRGSPTITSHQAKAKLNISPFVDVPSYPPGDMASIPHTSQLVKTQKKRQKSAGTSQAQAGYYSCAELDQPMRYNSKMMNSIWGRYNEDSVHNFKSLQCGGMVAADPQQLQQVSEPSKGLRQRLEELGQAVTTNFMDNLHQY